MNAFCYLTFFIIFVYTPVETSKIIIDNDWSSSASFIPVLLFLDADIEVLGLTVVVGDSWVDQETLHALRFLELSDGTSKIPVYKGATYPLLNTPFRMEMWQKLHGKIPWTGAFTEQNLTAEAAGQDPTGGNPTRIVLSALPEGLPKTSAQNMNAVNFLIEQVHIYPRQVSILALGPLTNIALAIKLNSTFAINVKEIIIQGGFLDTSLAQVDNSLELFSIFIFIFRSLVRFFRQISIQILIFYSIQKLHRLSSLLIFLQSFLLVELR
jgi:inosine-uridine nucleoside N-ribohydrolase